MIFIICNYKKILKYIEPKNEIITVIVYHLEMQYIFDVHDTPFI